jgi:hypothetical protein
MKGKFRRMKKQLEQQGGRVMISEDAPDHIIEAFFKALADCPDCAAAMAKSRREGNSLKKEH